MQQPPPPRPPGYRNFANLPTELQLHILLHIPTEKELLHFRLVSSLTNSLVLEPLFWRHLAFSKQLYFTPRRNPAAGLGLATHSHAMAGAHPAAPPIQASFHNSDAHLLVHRLSSALPVPATVSSLGCGQDVSSSPDQHATHSLPAIANSGLTKSQTSLSDAPEAPNRTWTMMEDSFLAFVSRLASVEHAALGVHSVAIEDWEHTESLKKLWQLQDLSGIQTLMPNVQSLNLEGCLAIDSFLPLTAAAAPPPPPAAAAMSDNVMEEPGRKRHLDLTSMSLINTNVNDKELIEVLKMSPDLEELRLDQCYRLTAATLEAIGRGQSHVQDLTTAPQAGTYPPSEPSHLNPGQHPTPPPLSTGEDVDSCLSGIATISLMKEFVRWQGVGSWNS
ncbi:hypothetical protein BGZ68_009688 [Mortierella alpina]|nr:hypothetical protein BGZ68_009688 [Mortierella alpina]